MPTLARVLSPLPRQVLVQLVLEVNEGVVPRLVEGHASQHRPYHVRPHTEDTLVQNQLLWLRGRGQRVLGGLQLALEHEQRPYDALET